MVDVRLASLNDLDRLLECEIAIWESLRGLLKDSFVDPNINWLRRPDVIERRKTAFQSADAVFCVAEKDNELVGVAIGRAYEDGVAILGFFGVKPPHRGKGVGFNLLSRFIEEAEKRKAHKVWLMTAPSLQQAIRLYVRAGFVPEGYLRKHSHGQDLIIYSKFLDHGA